MLATLPGQVESRADGALEAVDEAGKLLGIDEVEICIRLEIANRSLELLEVPRHARIISNTFTERKSVHQPILCSTASTRHLQSLVTVSLQTFSAAFDLIVNQR